MGVEIERKYLVTSDAWRDAVTRTADMRQGYLANNERCSVRVRLENDAARLNIKSATLGVERQEYEYPIAAADAAEMIETLCGGRSVVKTRHYVEHGGHTWEIDEFHGDNTGLVVAEVELASADIQPELPPWAGTEVSHERRYYNVALLEKPYKDW